VSAKIKVKKGWDREWPAEKDDGYVKGVVATQRHELDIDDIKHFFSTIWRGLMLKGDFQNWVYVVVILGVFWASYNFGYKDAPRYNCDMTRMQQEIAHANAMAATCQQGFWFMLESVVVEWRYMVIAVIMGAWLLHGVGFKLAG
jgi:hypothetical protein